MEEPEVTVATPADRERILATLVAAFVKDHVLRHLFPDEQTYPEYATAFFGYLFDKRVRHGSVWTVEGGVSVAIWQPPGVPPAGDEFALRLPPAELARVHAYDEVLGAAFPAGDYWYLGVLGTHPEHTGRRLGHAVMAAGLRRAAQDGLPAYLETSNRGNVEMYRRAGWEVVSTVPAPVPTWVMAQAAYLRVETALNRRPPEPAGGAAVA